MTKCAQVEVTVPDCVQYLLVNVRELSNATPKIFSSSVVVIVLPVSTGNDRINTDINSSYYSTVIVKTPLNSSAGTLLSALCGMDTWSTETQLLRLDAFS